MSFQELIQNFINVVSKKYFCFTGRTDRKTFWMYFLVCFLISLICNLIPGRIGYMLGGIVNLALLCPTLGITARRLHDTDKTGWLQLLALIPIVGGIIVLILCIPEGNPEKNQYDEADV